MTIIKVEPVLRSRNMACTSKIMSTFIFTYPRWIHAEQRTHRVVPLGEDMLFEEPTPSLMACADLSRNASSSRALPVRKMIEDVRTNPAIPLWWGKNEPGMQAWEELTGTALVMAKDAYMRGLEGALKLAEELASTGAHKQLVNRILEPYSHIRVLVSATEWDNYIELRDHKDAEPHILMLAKAAREELLRQDNVQALLPGGWHTPFVDTIDEFGDPATLYGDVGSNEALMNGIKLSTARCASISYKTVDGFDMTLDRAKRVHDHLLISKPVHASPGEHVARADELLPYECCAGGMSIKWKHQSQHGNLKGFRQYRHMLAA